MHPALWISKTGLDAQQTNIGVISNNLANVNTVGFKRGRPEFEDLLYQTIQQPGGQSSANTQLPTGVMLGTGVRTVATQKNYAQGNIIETQSPLDVAINGRGFFQINMPDGTAAYTRDGQFKVNGAGELVNASGYTLQPSITVPQGAQGLTIGNDGTVSATTPGSSSPTVLGTLQIVDFINPGGLQPKGQNLLVETGSSGSPITATPGENGLGILNQGSVESSNVNVVEELVHLIEGQRAYEMNSKSIQSIADMLKFIVQTV